jgi:hypothetical protein
LFREVLGANKKGFLLKTDIFALRDLLAYGVIRGSLRFRITSFKAFLSNSLSRSF